MLASKTVGFTLRLGLHVIGLFVSVTTSHHLAKAQEVAEESAQIVDGYFGELEMFSRRFADFSQALAEPVCLMH